MWTWRHVKFKNCQSDLNIVIYKLEISFKSNILLIRAANMNGLISMCIFHPPTKLLKSANSHQDVWISPENNSKWPQFYAADITHFQEWPCDGLVWSPHHHFVLEHLLNSNHPSSEAHLNIKMAESKFVLKVTLYGKVTLVHVFTCTINLLSYLFILLINEIKLVNRYLNMLTHSALTSVYNPNFGFY